MHFEPVYSTRATRFRQKKTRRKFFIAHFFQYGVDRSKHNSKKHRWCHTDRTVTVNIPGENQPYHYQDGRDIAKKTDIYSFSTTVYSLLPVLSIFFNKVSSAITFLCVKLVDRGWCRQKRMAAEKKSIKNFRAVAPTIREILPIKEIMLRNFVKLTFAGFSNFDPTFMNSK